MWKNNNGFTLIELLVVVAIVGILSTIAIYQYASYRGNAFCSRVESDVHNTVASLEYRYTSTESYSGVTPVQSQDNGIVISISAANDKISSVRGEHPKCTRGKFTFDPTANPTFSWIP